MRLLPVPKLPNPDLYDFHPLMRVRQIVLESMGIPKKEKKNVTKTKTLEQQIREAEAVKAPPIKAPLRITQIKQVSNGVTVRTHWDSSESDNEVTLDKIKRLQEKNKKGTAKTISEFKCRQVMNGKYKASWITTAPRQVD